MGLADEILSTNTDPDLPASHETHDATDTNNADAMHVDLADVTDTDASDPDVFQQESQVDGLLTETNTGEIAVDEPSDISDSLAEQSFEFQSHFSDTSTVVVDRFPFGNPGAPIPGATQGPSFNDLYRATHGDSMWAPFQSRRDWVVAHWAKTHSTTSSAVDDFLALPEVCGA
jgi:hypothetical protein